MIDRADVESVVRATLYEGYVLFPYRPTSAKNRMRWTFGAVFPATYVNAGSPGELSELQTECLLEAPRDARLQIDVRFLQPILKTVRQVDGVAAVANSKLQTGGAPVDILRVGGAVHRTCEEAVEERVALLDTSLETLLIEGTHPVPIARPAETVTEPILGDGRVVGALVRHREALEAHAEVAITAAGMSLFRITVSVRNTTVLPVADRTFRNRAALRSLASCHVVLMTHAGRWLSLADPPETAQADAKHCHNTGLWPALVGDGDDCVLASPVILEDHPRVAPESPGDLFDSSEIDELLTLSILALGDDEKAEMRADPRTLAILERTENLQRDEVLRLHGTLRDRPLQQ